MKSVDGDLGDTPDIGVGAYETVLPLLEEPMNVVNGSTNNSMGAIDEKKGSHQNLVEVPVGLVKVSRKNSDGNSITIAAKVDADLKGKITFEAKKAGMPESAWIRVALRGFIDSSEARSIAADIRKSASIVSAAAQSVSQPVVMQRLDLLELRFQSMLDGLKLDVKRDIHELLGEPLQETEEQLKGGQ